MGHATCAVAASGTSSTKVVRQLPGPVHPAGGDHPLHLAVRVVDERRLALPADELLARLRRVDDGEGFLQRHVVVDFHLELAGSLVTDHLFLLLLVVA